MGERELLIELLALLEEVRGLMSLEPGDMERRIDQAIAMVRERTGESA